MKKYFVYGCFSISSLLLTISCLKTLRRAFSIFGKSKQFNYLLQCVDKESKRQYLKEFKNMYVKGTAKPNQNLPKLHPKQDEYYFIHQLEIRAKQFTFPRGKVEYLAPSFYLQTEQKKIEINTHNKFPYCEGAQRFISMEDLDKTDDLLYQLGLASKRVQAGMKFDHSIIIFGDFIYNPQEDHIRCYKVKDVIQPEEFIFYKIGFVFKQFLILTLKMIPLIILLSNFYDYFKTPQIQELKVLISKQKSSLICSICNNVQANILFKPCFHLDCCNTCIDEKMITFCPVCKQFIQEKIKIFNE